MILIQYEKKLDYPCLAYAREKTRLIRDYTKKKENIFVDWIYLVS